MPNFSDPVIETLVRSGFDLSSCLVLGGAVLALHEIRQATDVDILLEPADFLITSSKGETPGGIRVMDISSSLSERRLTSITPPRNSFLPLDLITYPGNSFSHLFRQVLENSSIFVHDCGVLRVPSLSVMRKMKSSKPRPKDIEDIGLIDRHLSKH